MNRKLIIGAALAALLLVAACGDASDTAAGEGDRVPGISVSGEGRVTGTPDTLTVNVGVSVLRDTVDAAVQDAARLAQDLIDAVAAEDIPEEDVRTIDYSIFPEWDYQGERQTLRGYRVNNSLEVKIRALDKAGEIIGRITSAGGDDVQVHGLSFSLEDNQGLVAAARAAAWADAEAKAQQLAGLAGVELGAPVEIIESFGTPPPVTPFAADARAEFAAASVPIQTGSLAVTVTVNVRYELTG